MKKYYPSSISQTVILIVISVIISTPILILNQQVHSKILKYLETPLIYIVFCFSFILISKIVSNKRGLKYNFNYKVGKGIIPLILILVFIDMGIGYAISRYISLHLNNSVLENPFNDLVYVFTTVLLAPVLEEIIFRGIILHNFLKRYNFKKAIIYSTLIFGVVHVQPAEILPALIFGLISSYAYWRYKSLSLVIILHFIANLLSTIITYLLYKFKVEQHSIYGNYTFLIICVSIILGVISVYYFFKKPEPILLKYTQ